MRVLLLFVVLFNNYGFSAQTGTQNPQLAVIDVLHYKFELELSDTTNLIEANTNVKVHFLKDVSQFYLDLISKNGNKGMMVIEICSGNKILHFRHKDNRLLIYNEGWRKGDTANIDIRYRGIPADGLIISRNKYGAKTFFGDNWPDRARNWLPVVDHPSDKATVEFVVEVPGAFDVVASGVLKEKIKVNDRIDRYHFNSDIPLPTKVMVVGVADFNHRQYGEVDSVPVSSMIFASSPLTGLDDYRYSMEVLRFFIDSIGEFPFEKLVNVQSNTIYGGMENAGNIFYFENSVDGNKNYEDLIAHEIAHQWFGDAVTERDWSDIWLSEGFATYLASLYIEHKYGTDAFIDRMTSEMETVISYNSYKQGAVIETDITNLYQLLNPNTYQKSAWILHMLRKKTGDRDFFRILRAFYSEFRNKTAESSDFIRIVNEITSSDFSSFFDQWLYKKGVPDLLIKWSVENSILYFEILQKSDTFSLDLPVMIESKDNYDSFVLKIRKKLESFAIPLKPRFNPDNLKIKIDPQLTILQSSKVERVYSRPETIPLIEGSGLLQLGDLLFQDLDCGPLCDAIESVTHGYANGHFSHVGILINDEKNQLRVLEAIGEKVKLTPVDDFLNRYYDKKVRPKVVVGRPDQNTFNFKNFKNIGIYLGKTYDDVFDIDDDRYYCSELVYFLYTDFNGKKMFELAPMTFKDKRTGEFFPPWRDYYDKLKKEIPEGKPGINPGSISTSDKISIIYRYGDPEGWE